MHIQHPMRKQSGFSLIELMIGITIGMFIVAGMAMMFGNTSKSSAELEKSSRMIENGRYAADLLREDLQQAGYYDLTGLYGATDYSRADPCDTGNLGFATSPAIVVPTPVFGFNNSWVADYTVGGTTVTGGCATTYTAANMKYRTGTDVLVVRHASTGAPVTPASVVASTTYLQTSACSSDPLGTPFISAAGTSATFTLKNKSCSGPRHVRPMVSRVYFVATCNVCSGASADEIPTLKMLDLQNGAMVTVALVEGIENMQIEYRLDTDGDGVVDKFGLKADAIAQECTLASPNVGVCWKNVMAVDVYLLARNTEMTAGFQDTRSYTMGSTSGDVITISTAEQAFKRHAFTMTVRATNNAIQREVAP